MTEKAQLYAEIARQLTSLLHDQRDWIANLANCSALLYHALPDVNWAGFYLFKHNTLVLGPFQGRPACVRIELGRGVCGTAAQRRATLVVPDVHAFPGHIACDTASNSEIVVPLIHQDHLLGVLDLDSPERDRFDDQDRVGLEHVVAGLLTASDVGN